MENVHLTKSVYSAKHVDVGDEVFAKRYEDMMTYKDDKSFKYVSSSLPNPVELTVGEFHKLVDSMASGLYTIAHIKRKDVVCVFLPNCVEYLVAEAAIEASGFIMMPLNPLYKVEQLLNLFKKVNPALIVTKTCMAPLVYAADAKMKVLSIDAQDEDINKMKENGKTMYSYSAFQSEETDYSKLKEERNQILPSDSLFYGLTSGSTGEPKVCVYENKSFTANIILNSSMVDPSVRRTLSFVPMFTTTGHIVMDGVILKRYYYVFTDKFDTEKIFKIIQDDRITNVNGAPPAFLALLKHPNKSKYDLSTLREAVIGGAVTTDQFLESIKQGLHLEYCSGGYGMTELCGMMYRMPAKSVNVPSGPITNYQVRVVDHETREILPIGFAGELEVNSPIMMKEYLNNPKANAESFDKERWFKTGDEAVLEENGFMRITGRVKDMIIRGGHNVWPIEICEVLNKHPKVQESAVIGIPDKIQGEAVVAFIIVKKDQTFDDIEGELKSYLNLHLVPFSIPTFIFPLQEFPRTSFGKLYAPKLKEMVKGLIEEKWQMAIEKNTNKPKTEAGKEIAKVWSELFDIPIGALSRDSNFYILGGDSFVGAQTVAYVRKHVKDAPFNLLSNRVTIGEIEDYIENPTSDANCHSCSLMTDLEVLTSQSDKDLFGELPEKDDTTRQSVVVTGATGYLGIYIVNELCKCADTKKVYCIGRSANKSELDKKMNAMLRKTGLTRSDKIHVIVGDVSKDHMGVEEKCYQELQDECRLIIHCAAVVNWSKSYDQLKKDNVNGVVNVIKFAGKRAHICYISTIGAALNRDETISEKVPIGAFGYIQSKWMGEKVVEKARSVGCSISVIRPSFIIADSKTGICNTDDFVYKMLRLSVLNHIGFGGVSLPLTPVDKVAQVTVKNCDTNAVINMIPMVSTKVETLFTVLESMNYTLDTLSLEEWKSKVVEIAKEGNSEAMALLASLGVISSGMSAGNEYLKSTNQQHSLDFDDNEIAINLKTLTEMGFFNENFHSVLSRTK
ncbi:4-coumarate--CoA ligase, putative [Entamoeba invadens IP1]|uniref:4-coumarate--CoA ligase, putative n=1 Tax=Entamoeba invadens IP1 TaxID=370355 RepID=A0A0A1UCF5_ENTIV|nr:4-coumarate--CoA ligase, putative [Entamoeba invadens IP1]ELP91363.1 4-coumarate--CoA ligase, putative [Entamoeba invadens IP1]|eukprot:XP_004258134.1 4-coumarate--CoA ligase, putative [Entamoeba invadens IP1]